MLRILWRPHYDDIGNALGYTTHQKNTKRALDKRDDVEFVEEPEDADVVVDINTPTGWEPVDSAPNVLFTMYEATTLPYDWREPVKRPDLLIVPTKFNKQLFKKYRSGPISTCWEGMDPTKFMFQQRTFPGPGEKFVFLWIGASNPRKGYQHVGYAWDMLKDEYPEVYDNSIIIMKTTQKTKEERIVEHGNLRIDTHKYPIEDLVALYGMSHAFLFPTMGEGWGLTMHEAAATGLPVIYTNWSAPRDWFREKYGYPVKYRMKPITTNKVNEEGKQETHHKTDAAFANIGDLVRQMARVYHNYDEALHKGRLASEYVRKITWDTSAERLVSVLSEFVHNREAAA